MPGEGETLALLAAQGVGKAADMMPATFLELLKTKTALPEPVITVVDSCKDYLLDFDAKNTKLCIGYDKLAWKTAVLSDERVGRVGPTRSVLQRSLLVSNNTFGVEYLRAGARRTLDGHGRRLCSPSCEWRILTLQVRQITPLTCTQKSSHYLACPMNE